MLQQTTYRLQTFAAGLVACRINHLSITRPSDATCRRTPASARHGMAVVQHRRRKRRQRISHIVCFVELLLTSTSARCVSPKARKRRQAFAECVLQYLHAQHGTRSGNSLVNSQQLICQFSRQSTSECFRTSAIAIGSMISNSSAISLTKAASGFLPPAPDQSSHRAARAESVSHMHRQRQRLPLLMTATFSLM